MMQFVDQGTANMFDPPSAASANTCSKKTTRASASTPTSRGPARVMRLPGTINYPSKEKLAKGYPAEPRQTRLLFNSDHSYTLGEIESLMLRRRFDLFLDSNAHARNRYDGHALSGLRVINTYLNLRDPKADLLPLLHELQNAAISMGGVSLVVIDTLNSVMGAGDENESADMGAMTDAIDRAEIEYEYELAEALRQRKPAGPAPTGWCHWCGDAVDVGMRWCDHSCESSWEYTENRRRQNGRGE